MRREPRPAGYRHILRYASPAPVSPGPLTGPGVTCPWDGIRAHSEGPVTGELRNAERANLGTFVGAVCFLIGALLLLPERTETVSGQVPAPDLDAR